MVNHNPSRSVPLISHPYDAAATALEIFTTNTWRDIESHLNPWDDTDLQVLINARFAARVMKTTRSAEYFPLYWNHLPIEDQLVAQAEYSYYADLESHYMHLIRTYVWREYFLPNEKMLMTRFDKEFASGKLADGMLALRKQRLKNELTHQAYLRNLSRNGETAGELPLDWLSSRFASFLHLIPLTHPGMGTITQYLKQGIDANGEPKLMLTPILRPPYSEQSAYQLRVYRERGAAMQVEMTMSASLLFFDFRRAGRKSNQLKGKLAKTNMLLTDENIPVPGVETFLGWLGIAGLSFMQFNRPVRLKGRGGVAHTYTHALTYVSPAMPVTPDHLNHGAVAFSVGAGTGADESFSSHSLAYRSPVHRKDSNGDIDHGYSFIETMLLDAEGDSPPHFVAADLTQNTADQPRVVVMRHMQGVMDISLRSLQDMQIMSRLMGGFGYSYALLSASFFDPWSDGTELLPSTWGVGTLDGTADTGYRSLSRFLGIHVRLDSQAAHREWSSAMVSAATEWLRLDGATRGGLLARRLAAAKTQRIAFRVESKDGKYSFDISGFGE